MCGTRICRGLIISARKLLASSRKLIFGGQALGLAGKSKANVTYSEAKRQFSGRHTDVLKNVHSPNKWLSTLMSAVLGSSSLLPPLVSEGGGLVCESVGKADLLLDHFDTKQSREA